MQHSNRKREHIDLFRQCDFQGREMDYFRDIEFVHNALPEIDFHDISLKQSFIGKDVEVPILINAITGGVTDVIGINKSLASIAKTFGIPIAVGSQSIAVKSRGDEESFKVVRRTMGSEGVVIANMGAGQSLDHVKQAIDMLEADAIQLHINVAQEIIMPEGDRNFKGILQHIENLNKELDVPVIIKEVGFGISAFTAKELFNRGINYIDVSGKGGTNFIEIEDKRHESSKYKEFYNWGIPTPNSLKQCVEELPHVHFISSGGIKGADHVMKSLLLGADMVGMSGMLLRLLLDKGEEGLSIFLEDLCHKLKVYMLLTGCEKIAEIHKKPYYWKGELMNKPI